MRLSGRLAEQLAKTEPNGAIWANQFDNVANRQAHIEGTGPEIWQQTGGKIDGFTCAVGTGGTLAGVAIALKERNPKIRIAAADPLGAAIYSWIKTGELEMHGTSITEGIGQSRVTANLEGAPIDDAYEIPDEEALPMIFDLLEHEGLCLGGSTGINVAGAIRMARDLGPGHTIVTILADYGNRYQSKLFNPDFLRDKGLPAPPWLAEQRAPIAVPFEMMAHDHLVSTEWLAAHLDEVRVVDASWYMPDDKRDPPSRIRGRRIFPARCSSTLTALSDHATDLPHMLPPPDEFARESARWASAMATRWWSMTAPAFFPRRASGGCCKAMGHDKVAVLDGGLPKWKREGRALESGTAAPKPAHLHRQSRAALVRDFDAVKAALGKHPDSGCAQRQPLHRRGSRTARRPASGHMPGAVNVPYRSLLRRRRHAEGRRTRCSRLFAEKGVDLRAPIVTTCGSGITAAILMLALEKIGAPQTCAL